MTDDFQIISDIMLRSGAFTAKDAGTTIGTTTLPYTFRPIKAMQYPPYCRRLAFSIARHFLELDIHVVAACSAESILLAAEVARQLEARVVYTISSADNDFTGWFANAELHHGERILLIDSVIVPEHEQRFRAIGAALLAAQARLVGLGAFCNIGNGANFLNTRFIYLLNNEQLLQLSEQLHSSTTVEPA